MKLPPKHKSKYYIPLCPTISLNSTHNKTNYDNNFISIKKKILNINTNNIDFPYNNNNVYTNQINFHFIKNNTHNNNTNNESRFPKQKLIFTQSLGDLRKINNMTNSFYNKGNNTSLSIPRFKKTNLKILHTEPYRNKIFLSKIKNNNISNNANQNNINNNYNIKSTSHDKRLLDNKYNTIKKEVHNYNVSNNNIKCNKSNGTLLKQTPPPYKLQKKLNSLNNNDNNIKCIYTKSNPQTQLIKDNRRDTKRLLPFIKSNTSSSNNILNFFTEKVIQDFICKSIPKPFHDEHTFPSTTFSVNQNMLGLSNFTFFGIYKSIGKDGYHLSYTAKTKFEKIFSSLTTYYNIQPIQNNLINYNETDIYLVLKDNNYNLIRSAFNEVNNEIYETKYNKSESGFSVFLLLSVGCNIITASVGSLVRGLSVQYHNDNGKEIVSGSRLDGVNEDSNSNRNMCFGFGNQNVIPFISDVNVVVKNVKCVFIANSALFDIIKQNSICRVVTKSILLGDKKKAFLQKEKISDTGKRIVTLYNELCHKSMCLQEEIAFVLIYI